MSLETLQLSVSDPALLGSLERHLRREAPGTSIERVAGRPERGQQGALDVLTIAADSSVLVAVIELVKGFLQSRKKDPQVKVTLRKKSVTVTARTADEAAQIVDRLLK
jgi:hypothetical protein